MSETLVAIAQALRVRAAKIDAGSPMGETEAESAATLARSDALVDVAEAIEKALRQNAPTPPGS